MAGAAEILSQTHAENMVMEGDADVVESGGRTDFLAKSDSLPTFASTHVDRVLHDGDTVALAVSPSQPTRPPGIRAVAPPGRFTRTFPAKSMGTLRNIVIGRRSQLLVGLPLRRSPRTPCVVPRHRG